MNLAELHAMHWDQASLDMHLRTAVVVAGCAGRSSGALCSCFAEVELWGGILKHKTMLIFPCLQKKRNAYIKEEVRSNISYLSFA